MDAAFCRKDRMLNTCNVCLLSDCEEAYDQGILQRVDGFQFTSIKPRSTEKSLKACCYVHNDTSKQ